MTKSGACEDGDSVGKALQQLAREQMKLKLLHDVRIDIEISKLEGIDYKEYLKELCTMLGGFIKGG